jgi:hypothetical protein
MFHCEISSYQTKNNETLKLQETFKISHSDVYINMPLLVNSYIIKLHANLNVKIQKQLSLAHNHDQMN